MRGLTPEVQTRRLAGLLARKGYSGEVAWPIIRDAVDGRPSTTRLTSQARGYGTPRGGEDRSVLALAVMLSCVVRCCSDLGRHVGDRRDVELELDLLAHEDAAGLEGRVEGEVPVGAVDGDLTLEADPGVAERVLGRAGLLEGDRDRLGDAVDGEVAGDGPLGAVALDVGRDEGDLRVVGDVEEVGVFRWPSRCSLPVVTLAASMVTVTDELAGLAVSTWAEPSNCSKLPRTFVTIA